MGPSFPQLSNLTLQLRFQMRCWEGRHRACVSYTYTLSIEGCFEGQPQSPARWLSV